jgi:hypothetical protein
MPTASVSGWSLIKDEIINREARTAAPNWREIRLRLNPAAWFASARRNHCKPSSAWRGNLTLSAFSQEAIDDLSIGSLLEKLGLFFREVRARTR